MIKRHPNAKERIHSAEILIKILLQKNSKLLPEHRLEFLRLALWKVTEAEWPHKHKTQLKSKLALIAPKAELRHDHVFQRAKMAEALLKGGPNSVKRILKDAVGCTITKDEHTYLNKFKDYDGWDRYRLANIKVWDTDKDKLFEFPENN